MPKAVISIIARLSSKQTNDLHMTNEKFTSLPFSVKINKLLLEADYMGSCKIRDKVSVLYLMGSNYYEILYTHDMDHIEYVQEVNPEHLAYFCNFDLSDLM